MIYIDTEPYRKKKNYFGNRTTVEELYFERILDKSKNLLDLAELKVFIEKNGEAVFKHLILLPPEE
ncbi:hypothetical protein, partial [Streptococcus suis]